MNMRTLLFALALFAAGTELLAVAHAPLQSKFLQTP